MQTLKQFIDHFQATEVKATDAQLQQAIWQRLSAHRYAHKFSVWKRLGINKLLDLPIAESSVLEQKRIQDDFDPQAHNQKWDATLTFINGQWVAERSHVPQGLQVSVQEVRVDPLWYSFLNDVPNDEITASIALSMASKSCHIEVSQPMRIRFCHRLTDAGAHAANVHLHVRSGVNVFIQDIVSVHTDEHVAVLYNKDVSLAGNSVLEDGYLNALSSGVSWLCCQRVRAQRNAAYRFQQMTSGDGIARFYHQAHLLEQHASSVYRGVSLAQHRARFDQTLLVKHLAERTESSQVFKHVAKDRSLTNFTSRVYVAKAIRAVVSGQTNHNLVLDTFARALSAPELEIYSDEVQCAHGATVGALDAEALFYLCARGLTKDQAEALLVEGFIQSMIDDFPEVLRSEAVDIARHYLDAMRVGA